MKLVSKYGALVALGSLAWILAEYLLGFRTSDFGTHLVTSLFSVVVLILGILFAMRYRKQQLGSRFTFKTGFVTGLSVSLVAGVLMVVGQYVYLGVLDRDYLDRAAAWGAYVQVLDGKDLADGRASIDENAWKYNMNVRALGQIPYFLAQGAVVSSIAAIVMVKKKRV